MLSCVMVVFVCLSMAVTTAAAAQSPMGQEPGADPALIARADKRLEEARSLSVNAFAMSDENDDGRLDEPEWRFNSWLSYRRFDHDGDGSLNWAEFADKNCGGLAEGRDSHRWCMNSALDQFTALSRGRTAVTSEIIADRSMPNFRRNDLDRDGYVTRQEMLRASGVRR